ncbi:MAG: hypothetical protein EYC69_05840 [Bacteroidetes bacterium]|nr:MAG: hypothetical protein EYC69_05840 [Bacteroidota bacterium]
MLILENRKFIKTPFTNEQELEQVVIDNYEYIFGPSSVYLPKALIKTGDGSGTIPDGFAIDLSTKQWYIVEAELIHHHVWNHIAPQVSKQVIAAIQPLSKRIIEDLAVTQYQNDNNTKDKFDEQNIKEIDVRKVLGEILNKDPHIGLPIDSISNDLKEWARTLKYNVKLWTISKYVDFNNQNTIAYEFPEEFKPVLDTEEELSKSHNYNEINRYDIWISDLIDQGLIMVGDQLQMDYKPRSGLKTTYEAEVLDDGSLKLLGKVYKSPSFAALAGIQASGSDRKSVNGWTTWKTKDGKLISELREEILLKND